MRTNYRHKRASVKEGGSHWLSFSDMMSVLVLIFIFVVFSMLSTLAQEEGDIENMERTYNARINELSASLDAAQQALTESKAQYSQFVVLTSDLENANALLVKTQAELDAANAKLSDRAETEQTVIDLRTRLTAAEAQLSTALDETRDQANTITTLNARLDKAERDADDSVILITTLNEQLTGADAEIAALNGTLALKDESVLSLISQNNALTAQNKSMQAAISTLTSENMALINENAALTSQNEKLDKANNLLAAEINTLSAELDDAKSAISTTMTELGTARRALEDAQDELSETNATLASKQKELKSAQTALVSALSDVESKENQLSEYQKLLEKRQGELEQMIGVKAEIIEQLSSELSKQNISVQVDAQTGAIALPGGMLFDVGKNELSVEGKEYLDKFLPIYLNVLMSERFKGYIAEIIIEGHTDTTGKAGADAYLYNLELSQSRALSVSNYVLSTNYMSSALGLDAAGQSALRKLITSSGRSYSAIVYKGGAEDKEASRRVEIKFRLSDEETIAKMAALLRLMEAN